VSGSGSIFVTATEASMRPCRIRAPSTLESVERDEGVTGSGAIQELGRWSRQMIRIRCNGACSSERASPADHGRLAPTDAGANQIDQANPRFDCCMC
jgi:hypothetical protein